MTREHTVKVDNTILSESVYRLLAKVIGKGRIRTTSKIHRIMNSILYTTHRVRVNAEGDELDIEFSLSSNEKAKIAVLLSLPFTTHEVICDVMDMAKVYKDGTKYKHITEMITEIGGVSG